MTKSELADVEILQEKLYEEWEAHCINGRVMLTPKLVRLIYEFFGYLRKTYMIKETECEAVD